jgi:pyruvate dehydrogenase E1 component
MYEDKENCFYYITTMNENYLHPAMPKGAEDGIIRGGYLLEQGAKTAKTKPRVQLMGAGTILNEVIAAAKILSKDFKVEADIWSLPSINELTREGQAVTRWNILHPEETPRTPYLTGLLEGREGPFVAATDYMKNFAEQLRPFVPGDYYVLGTDGFGRSDTRANLRSFFEVNRYYIVVNALYGLARQGKIKMSQVKAAIDGFGLDPEKMNPLFA